MGVFVDDDGVAWAAHRMHDGVDAFAGAVGNSGNVYFEEPGQNGIDEVIDGRVFYLVESSAAEVAYGVAVAPVLQRYFSFGIQFTSCLEGVHVDESFPFTAYIS